MSGDRCISLLVFRQGSIGRNGLVSRMEEVRCRHEDTTPLGFCLFVCFSRKCSLYIVRKMQFGMEVPRWFTQSNSLHSQVHGHAVCPYRNLAYHQDHGYPYLTFYSSNTMVHGLNCIILETLSNLHPDSRRLSLPFPAKNCLVQHSSSNLPPPNATVAMKKDALRDPKA